MWKKMKKKKRKRRKDLEKTEEEERVKVKAMGMGMAEEKQKASELDKTNEMRSVKTLKMRKKEEQTMLKCIGGGP